jgi:hypothetical protein
LSNRRKWDYEANRDFTTTEIKEFFYFNVNLHSSPARLLLDGWLADYPEWINYVAHSTWPGGAVRAFIELSIKGELAFMGSMASYYPNTVSEMFSYWIESHDSCGQY